MRLALVAALAAVLLSVLPSQAPRAQDLPEGVSAWYQPAVLVREGNFRSDPSTTNPPLGTFPGGTQVLILGETYDAKNKLWYYISLYEGARGYMAATLLRPLPFIPAPPEGLAATVVSDTDEYALLVGGHSVTLHWVGWDEPGELLVVDDLGLLYLEGRQDGIGAQVGDWMTFSGFVTLVDANKFQIAGKMEYFVASLTGKYTCQHSGLLNFERAKGKKYWRLVEEKSPCGDYVEYLDIQLRDEK